MVLNTSQKCKEMSKKRYEKKMTRSNRSLPLQSTNGNVETNFSNQEQRTPIKELRHSKDEITLTSSRRNSKSLGKDDRNNSESKREERRRISAIESPKLSPRVPKGEIVLLADQTLNSFRFCWLVV